MSKRIVVFGAGGRAGRAAVAEAVKRGHEITAVVRDPNKYSDLGVQAVAGDVTDAASVAAVSADHDAAIAAVYDHGSDPEAFFVQAAKALVEGLRTPRLLWAGLASILPTVDGVLLMDTPGYPNEFRSFFLAHAAAADALRSSSLDWLTVSPAGDFDHGGTPVGRYRIVPADAGSRITYADLGVALLDEIDEPKHSRVHVGVEGA